MRAGAMRLLGIISLLAAFALVSWARGLSGFLQMSEYAGLLVASAVSAIFGAFLLALSFRRAGIEA